MSDLKVIKTPDIVTIGKRRQIATGEFNLELVVQMIMADATNDWLPISEVSKFVYGQSFKANNDRIRHYVWRVRKELLGRNCLLLSEGRPVEFIKIYVGGDVEEPIARKLVQKMHNRNDISASNYEKALELLEHVPQRDTGGEEK